MEFLRFGSSIPGSYWGCCAVCIIQNFKVDPSTPYSIELVDGDGGNPTGYFSGCTYEDVFKQRLRIGTFSTTDMPNHAFFAVLTESQVTGGVGQKWLKILKREGFEFIRTVDNSVYTGSAIIKELGLGTRSAHKNHIFALIRNIGTGAVADPYTPPKAWTDLEQVVPEAWSHVTNPEALNKSVQDVHRTLWNNLGPNRLFTEAELEKKGVPIHYAGRRSKYPQQPKSLRAQATASDQKAGAKGAQAAATAGSFNPFQKSA